MPEFRERADFYPPGSPALARWRMAPGLIDGNNVPALPGYAAFVDAVVNPELHHSYADLTSVDVTNNLFFATVTRDGLHRAGILLAKPAELLLTTRDQTIRWTIDWNTAARGSTTPPTARYYDETSTYTVGAVSNTYLSGAAIDFARLNVTTTPSAGASTVADWSGAELTIPEAETPETVWVAPGAASTLFADPTAEAVQTGRQSDETAALVMRAGDAPASNSACRWRGKTWLVASVAFDEEARVATAELMRRIYD